MRRHVLRLSIAIALVVAAVVTGKTQAAQAPATGASPFAGRWQIVVHPPAGAPAGMSEVPMAIVEIAGSGASSSGKLVDAVGAPIMTVTLGDVAVKDDQLTFVLDMMSVQKVTFTGKRVGDHLEGKASAPGDPEPASWVGRTTTSDKIDLTQFMQSMTAAMQSASAAASATSGGAPSATAAEPPTDSKAYTAAMSKFGAERVTALQQFLKDFPDSKMKEQASLTLAQSYPAATERIAALRKFLEDFPNSTSKDQANLQIALASPTPADKAAALKKFMADFPASRLKEQAEYQLTLTFTNPAERTAAQEQFVKDHPKSNYASTIYQSWFMSQVAEKPVNEAKLAATIDGYIGTAPDLTIPSGNYTVNMRASTMNTIADRLMANEVLLDKALDIIQKAVAAAGEKEEPTSRGMYTTTLGQVLFKLKRYDEAGDALKRAIQISGGDGDAEGQLFLGKFYEVKQDDDAARDAYLKAYQLGSPYDTKASLERLYVKKDGNLDGLKKRLKEAEDKADALYLAKPKAFEAGHFARPASKAPSKVVLTELFTGAECVPCVAADLAFDGIGERYGHGDVATLIYHLHIPGPDPMTNADTEARAKYYKVNATPTAIVDGAALQAGGGGRAQAEKLFGDYKGRIEKRLDAKPLATLADFKAKVDGETIKVTGKASIEPGAGDQAPTATLHLALVEDTVHYVGSNGIRFHNLVVRKLIGSPDGTPLAKPGTKTAVSEVANVTTIGAGLDAYLDTFEKSRSRPNAPFAFKERVDKLDPKKLLVVAFVQDEKTKEILQAVFVTPGK